MHVMPVVVNAQMALNAAPASHLLYCPLTKINCVHATTLTSSILHPTAARHVTTVANPANKPQKQHV
jgi:hypothetical protein